MNKVSRNDPCPCGSGKKYKRCCLAADAVRVAELNAAVVDVYRPAALPASNNQFVPAIACLKERESGTDEYVFALVRASRPLDEWTAIDEAAADLDSVPDATENEVGPGCLRYLDRLGYRTMPGIAFDGLKFPSEQESNGEVCEYCGHVHPPDDDWDDDDDYDSDFDKCDAEFKPDVTGMVEFIQHVGSIPVDRFNTPEVAATLGRLCESGFTREETLVMVLETMMDEVRTMTDSGSSEPDIGRFASALARLPEDFADQ